ncbi:class I SAM-dependent methyltransferase [Gudongella sp. DL1XJH-153]|uniref:class I SAM-dependent methyltransferase n=1 Tax=Gudongella sp. DL1XJH-153 TaxID=3409804 RepID=UPI003BB4DA71
MGNECKICGHETEEFNHEKFHMIFHQCNNCEFIWKDSSVHVSREDEFKVYENHNNSILDERYVNYFKDFINASIVPFAGEGREGLDFGSGPEPVLSMIMERDYGYEMDIYDKFYSTKKIYIGKNYDLITSTEVVEHMDDPLEYFRLFRKLLRDDGIIAIMTLFHPVEREKFADWFYIRDQSHISFFTPRTMEVIAREVGLEFFYTNNHRYSTFKIK